MGSSLNWEDSLDNPIFFTGKLHGQRSLVSYSPWGHKELDVTEQSGTHTHTHTHTQVMRMKGTQSKGSLEWKEIEANRRKSYVLE